VKALHLLIAGRVQGVGFRDWLVRTAMAADLQGWVRNRTDGRVEALLAGPPDAVDSVLAACHAGPRAARVTDIEAVHAEPPAEPGFRWLPTA